MNQSTKAIFALFLLLSAKAYSENNLISRALLSEQNLDPVVLEQLLKDRILLPSNSFDFFILNEKKVEQFLIVSKDQELKDFVTWLKSVSGNEIEINQKEPVDMTPASQDIKG